jgi:hypothetical protein
MQFIGILRLFQGIQPLFFIFFEEGIAAAIYDMRRLQYGRCGEPREKALLAPDCCLPSLLYDDYALEGQFVAQISFDIQQ